MEENGKNEEERRKAFSSFFEEKKKKKRRKKENNFRCSGRRYFQVTTDSVRARRDSRIDHPRPVFFPEFRKQHASLQIAPQTNWNPDQSLWHVQEKNSHRIDFYNFIRGEMELEVGLTDFSDVTC